MKPPTKLATGKTGIERQYPTKIVKGNHPKPKATVRATAAKRAKGNRSVYSSK